MQAMGASGACRRDHEGRRKEDKERTKGTREWVIRTREGERATRKSCVGNTQTDFPHVMREHASTRVDKRQPMQREADGEIAGATESEKSKARER